MDIRLRAASEDDFAFARNVYFETMRWIIQRLFGWDRVREEQNFVQFFKLDEVRIITADGATINLGSFYVVAAMQRRGIGTQVLEMLLEQAKNQSRTMTLSVVRINPARHFYEKHGFRINHQDEHKFYMRADPR
jgi:GNAT superfamily N-acetyltransferase